MHIAFLIAEKKPSFKELLAITNFSKPVLSKHLRKLTKIGFIYKDIVRPRETDDPTKVGKVIYKISPSYIDEIAEHLVGIGKRIPYLSMPEALQRKFEKHHKAMVMIVREYLKSLIPPKEILEELERE